jgi:hypothetical protein
LNDGAKKKVVMALQEKTDLETVLSFDQFPEAKTSSNIAEWLREGHLRGGIKPAYIMCHSTDGASNAVGSSLEFQASTSYLKESREIFHYICMAHQVNRSARYASGTGDFRMNKNIELSTVLKKMHEINGRIYRNETRLKVLFDVQKGQNRYVGLQCFSCICIASAMSLTHSSILFFCSSTSIVISNVIRRPYRGVATRWNSDYEEVKATNIFMGDLQLALLAMLGEKGCDANLLTDGNGDEVDKDSLMFTKNDEMILRQYECGSEPVVMLSKFFQMDVPTSHLVLVNLRARIAQLRQPKFTMYADLSHSPLESLTGRIKTETVISDEITDHNEHHGRVEVMQTCVKRFRKVFADDLEIRSGLVTRDEDDPTIIIPVKELPSDLAISCLIHPLVGGKTFVSLVWSS